MKQTQRTGRGFFLAALGGGIAAALAPRFAHAAGPTGERYAYTLSDQQWKARLSPLAYRVLRHEDTESPFTSPLNDEHRSGVFACAGCDRALFSSKTKFNSGTGWPSFYAPLPGAVGTKNDLSLGIPRTEVHCERCGGHLGHVFDDGPKPTGLRYCMNGVSLQFHPGKAPQT